MHSVQVSHYHNINLLFVNFVQILAKAVLQGTVKGGKRQGRQKKRWGYNTREWTGLEFAKSQRAVGNRKKLEETNWEIICGAPTTLAVKG